MDGGYYVTVAKREAKPRWEPKADNRPRWGQMTEEEMAAAWQADAKITRKMVFYRDHVQNSDRTDSNNVPNGTQDKILQMLSETEWMTTNEIIDATGFEANAVKNALYALSTKKRVRKKQEVKLAQRRNFWKRVPAANVDSGLIATKKERFREAMDHVYSLLTDQWQTRQEIEENCQFSERRLLKYLRKLELSGKADKQIIHRHPRGLAGAWRRAK